MDPKPIIPGIGVHSGLVMTVLGPIPVEDLGVTLTHEHIMSDVGCNGPEPQVASRNHLFHQPLSIELLGEVRALPQSNRDNQRLTDVDLMVSEVARYAQWGGRSIVAVSRDGVGRAGVGVQQIIRPPGGHNIPRAGVFIEL